jgi:hypothetical protein
VTVSSARKLLAKHADDLDADTEIEGKVVFELDDEADALRDRGTAK